MLKTLLLAIVWLMPFAASGQQYFSNTHYSSIDLPHCKGFWWLNEQYTVVLAYVDSANALHTVKPSLDVMMQIDAIDPSPDKSRVLITSHGEGHPYYTVYATDSLLLEESQSLAAVSSINPYPLWIGETKWLDNRTILFSSPIDFSTISPETRMGLYKEEEETDRWWVWDVVTGKVAERK